MLKHLIILNLKKIEVILKLAKQLFLKFKPINAHQPN